MAFRTDFFAVVETRRKKKSRNITDSQLDYVIFGVYRPPPHIPSHKIVILDDGVSWFEIRIISFAGVDLFFCGVRNVIIYS